ncbi:MAG: SIS domain-containing protein [Planctomycetota bacterium]|jgi:glucosamine--fructose-6-phosphate aminotransferase (isomerizing)
MCGIIAVLSRPDQRPTPDPGVCAAQIAEAAEAVRAWGTADAASDAPLEAAIASCETAVLELRGFPGLNSLLGSNEATDVLKAAVDRLGEGVSRFEQLLDQQAAGLGSRRVEHLNALLMRAKDAQFTLLRDRLGNLDKVRGLAAGSSNGGHLRAAYDVNVALNALDRLEVRGRDSAGLHLFVRGDFPDALLDEAAAEIGERSRETLFTHQAVRRLAAQDGSTLFSFVYKVAAEVGELGDNVRTIRAAIAGDPLLHRLLECPGAEAEILGHTRWASVGIISEANAHPLNSEEPGADALAYSVAALNGDVDNYQQLIKDEGLAIDAEITTDAKVIPMLLARLVKAGNTPADAFPRVVSRFDGSVAIGAASADEPGKLYLALRGSGQALYVGLADGAYIIASEPYGIVEETSDYLRLDGETPADPDKPGTRGQVVVLDASRAGEPGGVTRIAYDGTPLPVGEKDIKSVEITTRDVDRGDHSHYLRKEIAEAPESIRKTLRGRLVSGGGPTRVEMGEDSLPASIIERVKSGEIRRIRVIGQGTAAVAGQGVAEIIRDAVLGSGITVDAAPATEVSGFQMVDDMTDHLFVAISQSGTTTDTNRTVDLLRARGAAVIGIVNRRHSDLTERVDGVLYTSDGRDVEMSVASTKAFYSQIAAGLLLGEALAQECGIGDPARRGRLLDALAGLPRLMREMLTRDEMVAEAARKTAPPHRHWAIVGNGRNKIAAEEIRIKLSELCYKSIACDATEDKKHIDLSSEPLVLVCAAGLEGGTASDVAKEVAIYAAHKASPVVVATDNAGEWRGSTAVIRVPECESDLAFILSTMAGHLYGYHAAQAIDALALPLKEARGAIEIGALSSQDGDMREQLAPRLVQPFRSFATGLRAGRYNGVLEASTATRLSLLFRYATRALQLEHFEDDFGRVGTPGTAVEELTLALTSGIEELVRPIDAIKHQAKTVTVGISRGDEALLDLPIVQSVLESGVPRERLPYSSLRVLQALNPVIDSVSGYTRYEIDGLTNGARIRVLQQGGLAKGIASRTEGNHELKGTKNTVAREGRVTVAIGRSDGRPMVLVPESQRGTCTGLVLLHVVFRTDLDGAAVRQVLNGYRNRYAAIRDAVSETDTPFSDDALTRIPVLRLLTEPVDAIADELAGAMTG